MISGDELQLRLYTVYCISTKLYPYIFFGDLIIILRYLSQLTIFLSVAKYFASDLWSIKLEPVNFSKQFSIGKFETTVIWCKEFSLKLNYFLENIH